ncbi:MAG: DUF433 domain-containing protein [Armatimonadetes bacterium]|nr:DUF433 domain-containing protein [Anaerolineae bacterium]
MMISTPLTMLIPLRTDEYGAIRIGTSRVLLEVVLHAYARGETPASIVDSYSTLTLGDVYAVLAYYLAHQPELEAYVQQRDAQAAQIVAALHTQLTPAARALRARLKAYQADQAKQR